jgi:hypothetical protein
MQWILGVRGVLHAVDLGVRGVLHAVDVGVRGLRGVFHAGQCWTPGRWAGWGSGRCSLFEFRFSRLFRTELPKRRLLSGCLPVNGLKSYLADTII